MYRKKWFYAACFSFLVLLSVTSYLLITNSGHTNDKLFECYYKTEEAFGNTRSSSPLTEEELIAMAIQYYNIKDYEKALLYFNQSFELDKTNILTRYFSGIAYIETGNYEAAIETFQYITVTDHGDNLFVENALWYTGLCYLKLKQNKKAIEKFNQIESDYYITQIKDILDKIVP